MRRNAGLGAINKKKLAESKFKEKGYELAQDQLNELSKHLDQFRDHLQDFAAKHKHEIKKNPTFRRQFQGMWWFVCIVGSWTLGDCLIFLF